MKDIIPIDYNAIEKGQEWLKEKIKNDKYDKYAQATLYTSMVYSFSKHLPYSMDIMQDEYVPADFFNSIANNREKDPLFKKTKRGNFFGLMIEWKETFKTGILLQLCFIFQKMLLGEFPIGFEIEDSFYEKWEINKMTNNEGYNINFFETLKLLPDYYQMITSTSDIEERRNILDIMYEDIKSKIATNYGTFKYTDFQTEKKASDEKIKIRPTADIEMRVFWYNIEYYDGIKSIIGDIKEEQIKSIEKNEIENKIYKLKLR